ncbi:MAG: K(+)-transporting ATPase subunit F [Chamaesiphon sp.]|nr:K(+)-transporting ATPase subunit F [Chamaesiphon sp.]
MKHILSPTVIEDLSAIATKLHDRKSTRYLLWSFAINLILAPVVYAATGGTISREQSYALGILGIVTVALSLYLFLVIFQPEKF